MPVVRAITPTVVCSITDRCNGSMVYTFTYVDCASHSHAWTYTYTISAPDFTLPTNGASTVNCPADAVAPTPPTVLDACGRAITPTVVAPSPVTAVTERWSIRLLMLIVQITLTPGPIHIRSLLLTLRCQLMALQR